MKTFDTFRHDWQGRSVNYDGVFGSQCVDLILQYLRECYGISSGVRGNAIDYWTGTSAPLLQRFRRQQIDNPVKGDIVIFKTSGRDDYQGDGHIGVATGWIDGSNVEILEQNGYGGADGLAHPDGSHRNEVGVRRLKRSRIAGVLQPIVIAPPPPPILPDPFRIAATFFPARQIRINKQSNRWDVKRRTFEDMASRPVEPIHPGRIFTVTMQLSHDNGHSYYLVDGNDLGGINVADCEDYTPPVPAPPAKPVEYKPAKRYKLITTVMAFETATAALMHNGTAKPLEPSSDPEGYYVIAEREKAYNLSDHNMHDRFQWVNIDDNVLPEPPKPAPIEELPPRLEKVIKEAARDIPTDVPAVLRQWHPIVISPFNTAYTPVAYRSSNSVRVKIKALDGKEPQVLELDPGIEMQLVTTFVGPDGRTTYAQDEVLHKSGRYYALPMSMLKPVQEQKTVPEPVTHLGNGKFDIEDITELMIDFGGRFKETYVQIADVTAKTVKRINTRKVIDGFKAGATKRKDKVS
jgi:hypothetical protein